MTAVASRRALFARFRGGPPQLRPPWAIADEIFVERCTRCSKCIEACPAKILTSGHGGFPIINFAKDHCTFCRACADACEAGCFAPSTAPAWDLRAAISNACIEAKGVTCRMCGETCDVSAIRFKPRLGGGTTVSVSLPECSGCGACVSVCPVRAISIVPTPQSSNQTAEAPT